LWSGTYDRTLDDIFAVQDDIAGAVVEELRTTLMGESAARAAAEAKAEVAAASSARADNPEAYQLYIQGRYYLERRTETDLAKAVDYFEQAIALDRQFALGWVGLSSARQTQAAYGWVPLREGFERARDAAERAIALAPDLAEAHISLGIVLGRWDWNWKGEIREMRQAVALAPANADALYSLGNALARQRNKDESLALLRRAVALDPLSSNKRRNLGGYCFEFGLPEEAEREMEVAFDLNSRGAGINQQWSILCLLQGRNVRALELAEREPARPFDLLGIACARHAMGEREASDAALAEMIADYANDSAYQVAEVHAWRGERDAAFEWLERACVQRDPGIVSAFIDPLLRGIHGDPRWMTLMKKTGFVE
jgi:serine/threonine-protein kinase